MATRRLRWLVVVAVVLALAIVLRHAFDAASNDDQRVAASRAAPERSGAQSRGVAPAPAQIESRPAAAATVPSSTPRPSADRATGLPIQLHIATPADARVGDPLEIQVHVAAVAGLQRLLVSITFDRRRLVLVGASEGDLAQRAGTSAEFTAQEPSDGNIDVTFAAQTGTTLAGSGSVAILRFDPIAPGVAAIAARNVSVVDGQGVAHSHSGVVSETTATIH